MNDGQMPLAAASPSRMERFASQVGHRLGAAALLLLVAGAAMLLARKPHWHLLVIAFGCADVALVGALVALVMGWGAGRRSGEALATVLFCAAVLLGAIALLVLSHLRGHE